MEPRSFSIAAFSFAQLNLLFLSLLQPVPRRRSVFCFFLLEARTLFDQEFRYGTFNASEQGLNYRASTERVAIARNRSQAGEEVDNLILRQGRRISDYSSCDSVR